MLQKHETTYSIKWCHWWGRWALQRAAAVGEPRICFVSEDGDGSGGDGELCCVTIFSI